MNRSTAITKPVAGLKRPMSGRAVPGVTAIREEKTAMEIPSIEVFEVADVGSDLEVQLATLDFMI